MTQRKKLILTGAGTLLVCYILICVYFYFIQVSIIFGPSPLPQSATYDYKFNFEERFFDTNSDIKIHAIHAKTDSAAGLVIYFHGNRGNNRTNSDKYQLFLDNGYDVLYPDYRGYGKSTGDIWDENNLIKDVQTIYSEILNEYEEETIVLVGYSLGTGVAAKLAAANNPKHLILWAPYYSILDLKDSTYPFLPDFLVRFPLRTDLALQEIEEPVTIFFAENDEVLPLEQALRLTEFLKEEDEYFLLEGQRHGWVYRNPVVVEEIEKILRVN